MRSGINNNSVWPFGNLLSYCWGEDPSRNLQEEDANKQLEVYQKRLLKELEEKGYDLQHAREELKNNKMVVLEAVKKRGFNLQHASEDLKTDREVVLMAVKENGVALQFASETLREDREVVLEAVNQHGYALEYAGRELMGDRELILEAVKKRGFNLQHASEDLKTDREVVLMAVKKNGAALQFASETLREDREFVLEAVGENDLALQFASEKFKLEFKGIKLFLFHDKIKAIMDEKNAIKEAKIKRINEIIHGSTEQLEQMPFIKASDALRYLAESIGEAHDSEKKKKIEDFCKKNPNKSSAILTYLATSYLVFIDCIDYEHIDPEAAKPENGFNYFTQKLLENYKQEKTPSPQTSGASAESQSSSSQQP